MAKQHGTPGEGARVRGTMVSLTPMFVAFAAMGAFLCALVSGVGMWWCLALFVAAAACAIALWPRTARRIGNYFKGARGEERVAGALAALPDGWHVFHDIALGAFRVDHLVTGPGGVFAVETKDWSGTVSLADGRILAEGTPPPRDPLAQARREADAARALLAREGLDFPVKAVLCFASGTFDGGQAGCAEADGVSVLNVGDLANAILRAPESLTRRDCERAAAILSALPD